MHAVNQCPTAISNVAIFAEPVGTRSSSTSSKLLPSTGIPSKW
ncbi:hypothetical protein HMPREF9510_01285 [Enterococcus faecalis TX0470]|nr:hypothetical protein HMPREF9510_01285 [Enterococcus faecalis TX0470]EFU87443.1 hypothetical protein HMPREF9507_01177 [Enterococcus faecalis TX0309B]